MGRLCCGDERSVSADGSVVAGYGNPVDPGYPGRAWRWTPSDGALTELQLLATTWFQPQVDSSSGDGKIIVGNVLINSAQHAIRWSGTTPTRQEARADGTLALHLRHVFDFQNGRKLVAGLAAVNTRNDRHAFAGAIVPF